IRLGPGVTNPFSRHPALIAAAIATLDELSGGRAALGLGAGGTNHRALGVERKKPVSVLRSAVALIRELWAGASVTIEHDVVRAVDAKLDFEARADIPIAIGARGPKTLALAGEIADGVIVGNVASPEGWRYALERISEGVERAGRDLDEVELTAWFYCSLADDAEAAIEAVRPMAATSLMTSRPVLQELGIDMPARFATVMEDLGWRLDGDAIQRAARAVPDELVHRFALAGTPSECRAALGRLLDEFPQISVVAIVPFAPGGGSVAEVVRRFIREVALEPARERVA
ncbi:MAG: LLM class flavin-dependent oxidoreductase, partial [Chloroflexota bacterium]|nr:LLM class flavin-dependent oxidoreductase [Chloroflexota bacterium]